MLCLIGNVPSSGSTLLADLLDSTDFAACGPELEFFCNRHLYNFLWFKQNFNRTSNLFNLRSTGIFPKYNRLSAYGLEKDSLREMVEESIDIEDFFNNFSKHFLKFRNKQQDGITFEKTPQNINSIEEYLKYYPKGYFLTIVRNPLYVYNSLLNRNWGNYTALCTWLVIAAKIIKFLDHERVILIKYEDLVQAPFQTVATILNKMSNQAVEPEKIEQGYKNNKYRKMNSRGLQTWEAKAGEQIIDANKKSIHSDRKSEFSKLLNLRIGQRYAKHYDLPEITFTSALKKFGYYEDIMDMLDRVERETGMPEFTRNDYRKLILKWLWEIKTGDSDLKKVGIFFKAVQPL